MRQAVLSGEIVERGLSSWRTRYLWHYEAVHLLYRCGFKVEECVGEYGGGPVTESGQLIFVATRRGHVCLMCSETSEGSTQATGVSSAGAFV